MKRQRELNRANLRNNRNRTLFNEYQTKAAPDSNFATAYFRIEYEWNAPNEGKEIWFIRILRIFRDRPISPCVKPNRFSLEIGPGIPLGCPRNRYSEIRLDFTSLSGSAGK